MKNTRRNIMWSSLAVSTWSMTRWGRAAALAPGDAINKDDSLFSFVQLNDMHVHAPERDSLKRLNNDKLPQVIKSINQQEKFKLPDFVVLVGDLIRGESLEWLLPECRLAKRMLSKLQCPYYPVVGNHEVQQREGDPRYQGPYEEVFGADRVNYHFVHKGILFVCVNNSGSEGGGDAVSDQRNKWLADVLRAHPDMPKIIACHVPLVCFRDEDVLSKSFGFDSYKMRGDEMWDIIRKEKETVIAVLNGHLHLTGVVTVDDIVHISASGLSSYPCDYAHYTVCRDRIEVAMHKVRKDLMTPVSNIHGIPRYKNGFTDSTHPTAEEYVSGNKGERNLTIPLPEAKRPHLV